MDAGDLQTLLAAIAWRLRTRADDNALACSALREIVRECAQDLQRLGPEAQSQGQALAQSQDNERRERRRAEHDSLTALPNRSRFDSQLSDQLESRSRPSRSLAVLFLDLDQFKAINDRHGHAVGDALLRVVALRLQRAVRVGDVVCRLGGDEFGCLVSGPIERRAVARLAGKLIAAVAAPFRIGRLELSVRPSVGIAMCPTDGDSASVLLQRADAAMFRAKQQPSGMAFYEPVADVPNRSPAAVAPAALTWAAAH
ncbi:GGDEF domain-containing protein [Rubrivivax gelatinosus]|uniref:GGDEF domain-containing protein n=1 Tax=Rubrivivax gelatinosus TaxID=28068 RepID=A0ABS1DV43_RUBGE|nr:GGDEF domain-containing protein [Rubrivivax gelatinosus]MBK1713608.1 hypothetical protein [Rubrivivax gelatinosus]